MKDSSIVHLVPCNRSDNVLFNVSSDGFESYLGVVLCGNYHRVNTNGLVVLVFYCNLSLSVGTEIGESTVLSYLCEKHSHFVSHGNGKRHKLGSLVAGKSEHHTLVTCACIALVSLTCL